MRPRLPQVSHHRRREAGGSGRNQAQFKDMRKRYSVETADLTINHDHG